MAATITPTYENFSIHALLAESDRLCDYCERTGIAFLSTLSLRRATIGPLMFRVQTRIFYPRSPCGERPPSTSIPKPGKVFSIHALLAESDRPW